MDHRETGQLKNAIHTTVRTKSKYALYSIQHISVANRFSGTHTGKRSNISSV